MRLSPLILAALVVACTGTTAPATDSQATVTDSAGVAIVQNHHPVWQEGEGWRVSAEPILVIADTMATGEGRFLMSAARLSNGEVVVLTDQGGRWFRPDGALLRTFAHHGEGPGEFRYATTLMVTSGDSVVVAQTGAATKAAWFGRDGNLLREQRIDYRDLAELGRWAECNWALLPDYSLLGCQADSTIAISETNRPSRVSAEGMSSPGPGLLRRLLRIHRVPSALDTTFALGLDIGLEQFGVTLPNGNEAFVRHPFHTRSFVAAGGSPLRIALATNPGWQVEIWTPEGLLERIVRLDGGRRATTPAEAAWADSLMRSDDFYGFYGRDPAMGSQVISQVPTPDSLPGHAALVMASGGELINRESTLWRVETPTLFTVFDRDGRWLGNLTLPPKFRLVEVGEDYLLGFSFDEDDVPTVVVYGLER